MFNDSDYNLITKNILEHEEFLKLKHYKHHNDNLYNHSLRVSYHSYKLTKFLHLDYISTARAGLLHDFFQYDWRLSGKTNPQPLFKKHGFTHANAALKNSLLYFDLSIKEKDIISKHMFPLNIKPPMFIESWIVNIVDKFIAIKEYTCK